MAARAAPSGVSVGRSPLCRAHCSSGPGRPSTWMNTTPAEDNVEADGGVGEARRVRRLPRDWRSRWERKAASSPALTSHVTTAISRESVHADDAEHVPEATHLDAGASARGRHRRTAHRRIPPRPARPAQPSSSAKDVTRGPSSAATTPSTAAAGSTSQWADAVTPGITQMVKDSTSHDSSRLTSSRRSSVQVASRRAAEAATPAVPGRRRSPRGSPYASWARGSHLPVAAAGSDGPGPAGAGPRGSSAGAPASSTPSGGAPAGASSLAEEATASPFWGEVRAVPRTREFRKRPRPSAAGRRRTR